MRFLHESRAAMFRRPAERRCRPYNTRSVSRHDHRAMTRDPRLTLNARQQELLEWVQRDGFVTVDDLAAHFAVTPQTIRRDVNWLAVKRQEVVSRRGKSGHRRN
ncbi:DeoR family transcriptional regulator, partial [Burkholderia cenocepacia]|uniref:DeoR family transcriptional regulator n=2 Tax=Burkholderia cenocepacia TaxID=95486 RepID=UPI001F4ADBC9